VVTRSIVLVIGPVDIRRDPPHFCVWICEHDRRAAAGCADGKFNWTWSVGAAV
jgi:hypothetical protein